MVLKSVYSIALSALLSTLNCQAEIVEFIAKQDINNVRFISNDGTLTLYQRRSGDLLSSKNFKIAPILESNMGTQYYVHSSPAHKYLVIEKHAHFHDILNPNYKREIFLLPYGQNKTEKLGQGMIPQLHLNDEWASYYESTSKKIFFTNLSNKTLNFQLSLSNKLNPYFIPQVAMINHDTVLITDINERGYPGILSFTRSKKEKKLVYKANNINQKIELCLNSKGLFVGEFPLENNTNQHSYISFIEDKKLTPFDYGNREVIYDSKATDLGQLTCRFTADKLYFIKNTSKTTDQNNYEIAMWNLADKNISIETKLNYVTQIMEMDGRIIFPHQGKYYLLNNPNQKKVDFNEKLN